MVLGGRAVQHRELQGHESDKFLSYFKPCIIPLEGGVASGFRKVEKEEFETRLYVCKGKRVVRMRQVPFARSSLNHDDIFILDTEHKIYQFNGANSNIQERAKALEVIQYLKEQYHEGTCNAAVVDDGKLDTESDSGEFWVIFGGFAPLGRKVGGEDDVTPEKIPAKLYSISDGEAMPLEGELSKGMLKNSKCYLLDCGDEVFVWVGRATQLEDRKAASKVAEEFVAGQNRPKWTCTTRIIQGYETRSFRSNFDTWPAGSATPASEEGRGRVAALLKQQGMDVKGSKSNPVNEEDPTLLKEGGKTEVWYIDGSAKSPVSKGDVGKFHTGDCYIVLYTYHAGERKEDYFLCCWFGKNSKQEDQKMAVELANTVFNSLKGRPVQGRIFEGKEPPQFTALFQPMVVLKGGMSSAYKNELVEKGLTDETYNADQVALFRLSGTSVLNCKAIQVDAVATSLNSTECLVLQSGSMMFTWNGNKSSYEQQQLGAKVAGFLKPGGPIKHAKEGTESSAFWFALGGKQGYTSKRVSVEVVREPHLFTFSFDKGKFEVEEVYNFSQDDLLTEDMLILDTHAEVFVWVGQCVDIKEKQTAFEIGQKYIDMAASLDGLPPDVPLYKVPEGSEPCFFTTFFSWDHTKASVHGNSFQKKVALLFGAIHAMEEKSSGNHGGPTQRASALAALSSAFNPSSTTKSTPTAQDTSSGNPGPRQRAEALAALTSAFNSSSTTKDHPSSPSKPSGQGSQRAAAVAALSSVLTAETKKLTSDDSPDRSSDGTPVETSPRGQSVSEMATSEVEGSEEPEANKDDTEAKEEVEQENIENKIGQITFSYEQLKVHSENPVTGIDFKQREAYMGDEEFEAVLGMTKEAFYEMPKWKQDVHKKKVDLF